MLYNLIILITGAVDIFCSLCILQIVDKPYYAKWSLCIYEKPLNEQEKRYVSYIIFMLGFIRFICGCHSTNNIKYVLCCTYFIEAAYIAYEYLNYKTINKQSTIIIVIGSILTCLTVLYLF